MNAAYAAPLTTLSAYALRQSSGASQPPRRAFRRNTSFSQRQFCEKYLTVPLFWVDEICNGTHDSVHSYLFFPIRAQKSNPIVTTGLLDYSYRPIVQALAPCPSVGCCAIIGLVPHALFIGWHYYTIFFRVCQDITMTDVSSSFY